MRCACVKIEMYRFALKPGASCKNAMFMREGMAESVDCAPAKLSPAKKEKFPNV